MALATQCPHCHTTFRVAHDQLKLRAGLVRCGACSHIFNGIENLLRLEEPAPAPPAPATEEEVALPATSTPPDNPEPPLDQGVDFYLPPDDDEPIGQAVPESESEQPNPPAEEVEVAPAALEEDARDESGEIPASEEDVLPDDADRTAPADMSPPDAGALHVADEASTYADPLDPADDLQQEPARSVESVSFAATPEAVDEEEVGDDEPSFVRQGRRRQRLGRVVHTAMLIGTVLLLLALLGQVAYVFRDQLAARLPQVKPLLLRACAYLDCQVGLPATIDALTIESSELQTLEAGSSTLALTVLLRNSSPVAQTWPHLELTLNDSNEKPLVRRVFAPAEYLPPDISPRLGFPARSEQSVRLFLELEGTEASGYRVYLFHP